MTKNQNDTQERDEKIQEVASSQIWPSQKPTSIWIGINKIKDDETGIPRLQVWIEANEETKIICDQYDVEDEFIVQSHSFPSLLTHHNQEIDELKAALEKAITCPLKKPCDQCRDEGHKLIAKISGAE